MDILKPKEENLMTLAAEMGLVVFDMPAPTASETVSGLNVKESPKDSASPQLT